MDYWPIDKLHEWADNPRRIGSDEYELLKKKITRWGQFKPLVVRDDGTVLGGNMRLRAYRELGINKVWVSVVKPVDDAEALEIALADNELSGQWVPEQLKALVTQYPGIDLTDYKYDGGAPLSLAKLVGEYKEVDLPGARDSIAEKEMICPHCGQKILIVV